MQTEAKPNAGDSEMRMQFNRNLQVMPVNAGFDTGTAQSTINSYLDPLRQFLLWFVPVAFVVSALISGSKWFFMD